MSEHAFILYGNYQNPYIRLVRIADGLVFDVVAGQLAPSPAWADSALSLGAKDAVINGWPVDLPENLPHGAYDLQLYDAAAPDSTDAMIAGWRLVMPHKLVVNPTEFPLDVFGRIRMTGA
jgi:hypothetical protein